jgi:phosphinothricin acetyltransferase
MTTRPARPDDAAAIAAIYNQGIQDRQATFETEARGADDVLTWLESAMPLVVVEQTSGAVAAWAGATPYRPRRVYSGVAEFSVYVAKEARGTGLGKLALAALIEECRHRGYWKLVSRIFPENGASRSLCRSLGFREVGVYRRHARLDGEWKDCVIVEVLLDET